MKIAIFGAGNVGSALGHRLVHAGHHVSLAASRPDSPRLIEAATSSGADPAASLEAAVRPRSWSSSRCRSARFPKP